MDFVPVTAARVTAGASLPSSPKFGQAFATPSALSVCLSNGTWTTVSGGGGGTIPSVTTVLKGDGAGNAATTKVSITSPATAATLAFGTDNATITFQGTDTYVGRATTDTLTNKTLTAPVIGTIVNTGTLTLPTSTDTLVGRATTDTLTNKTFDTAGTGNVFKINGVTITANTGTGSNVLATSPALVTPALGTPTSGNLSSCTNIPVAQATGILPTANGGTGGTFWAIASQGVAAEATTYQNTVATTGKTTLIIKRGAGDVSTSAGSGAQLRIQDATGTDAAWINGNGNVFGNAFLGTGMGIALNQATSAQVAFRDIGYISWGNGVTYGATPDASFGRTAAGEVSVGTGTQGSQAGSLVAASLRTVGVLVSALPAAGTAGRRRFVTDANATTFASIVAGSGSNGMPVYDDGANWRIG